MAWPASLPQKMRMASFATAIEDANIRTQMDYGPDFVRPRTSITYDQVTGDMVLTTAQVATLKAYYRTTLINGSEWFDWNHPETENSTTFRFLRPPTFRPASGRWIVSMAFEVVPA